MFHRRDDLSLAFCPVPMTGCGLKRSVELERLAGYLVYRDALALQRCDVAVEGDLGSPSHSVIGEVSMSGSTFHVTSSVKDLMIKMGSGQRITKICVPISEMILLSDKSKKNLVCWFLAQTFVTLMIHIS